MIRMHQTQFQALFLYTYSWIENAHFDICPLFFSILFTSVKDIMNRMVYDLNGLGHVSSPMFPRHCSINNIVWETENPAWIRLICWSLYLWSFHWFLNKFMRSDGNLTLCIEEIDTVLNGILMMWQPRLKISPSRNSLASPVDFHFCGLSGGIDSCIKVLGTQTPIAFWIFKTN